MFYHRNYIIDVLYKTTGNDTQFQCWFSFFGYTFTPVCTWYRSGILLSTSLYDNSFLCSAPSVHLPVLIIRWSPPFLGCFNLRSGHPPVSGSAVVAATQWIKASNTDCLDDSITSMLFFQSFDQCYSHVLSFLRSYHCDGNPIHPTSTGNGHMLHPGSLQSAVRFRYLRLCLSCVSSQCSSHGMVSFIATSLFNYRKIN